MTATGECVILRYDWRKWVIPGFNVFQLPKTGLRGRGFILALPVLWSGKYCMFGSLAISSLHPMIVSGCVLRIDAILPRIFQASIETLQSKIVDERTIQKAPKIPAHQGKGV